MKKDIKEDLIHIFKTLYLFHSTLGSRGNQATRFRISSYGKILSTLEKWKHPIYSSADLKDIPSIGKSTLEKIDIIQRTGTHPLYEEVIHRPEYQILSVFQRVRGVGPEKAYQFYRDGYRSLSQLRKDVLSGVYPVHRDLKAAFLYLDELEDKISRREITQFTKYVEKRYQLRLINSGSYRMGKSKSGDIDLLCVISSRREVPPLLKRMEESEPLLWKYIYNKSTKKVNGIIQNPLTKKIHQMDMIFVYEKEVPWMLLYFGSGKEFSKKIRAHAIQKGYKLNEKGLYYHKTNRRVSFYPKDEREIFDFLEYPYVKPEDRG